MTPVTDEQVMRAALADLTDDQPPMPPGRLGAVRRRAIQHRRRQLAGAVVSALAVAGIIVGAGRLPGILHQQPQARHVRGWALPWPDYRNGSVPQSVLNNAVLAWGDPAKYLQGSAAPSPREIARLVASYDVTWYAGQTVAHGHDVAVMFEATSPDTGPQLVVGLATASEVMHGQPAWKGSASPWVLTTTAAPARPSAFGPDISEYFSEPSKSGTGTDTWIVVLPAPGAQFGNWTVNTSDGGVAITGVQSSGVFATDVGQLNGDVVLSFGGRWRNTSVPVGTGSSASVPPLAAPPALVPPASFHEISALSGQGSSPSEDDLSVTASGGPYAVLGTCYNAAPNDYGSARPAPRGHGRLQIVINGHRIGSVPCDLQQHELAVPRSVLRPHGIMISGASSSLTSWLIGFGRAK